jgi:hypothetical protein
LECLGAWAKPRLINSNAMMGWLRVVVEDELAKLKLLNYGNHVA